MSRPLKKTDPCYWMLADPTIYSEPNPEIYRESCCICRDPEFAQLGMPLCYACQFCGGHVAADDVVCDDCGKEQQYESGIK